MEASKPGKDQKQRRDRKDKNEKEAREKVKPFFQKQKKDDGNCRVYAINNAVGRSSLSLKKFCSFCDEFDRTHKCKGSREFFFIDTEDNLISFILHKLHFDSE